MIKKKFLIKWIFLFLIYLYIINASKFKIDLQNVTTIDTNDKGR
jgi:hypothetical protein